MISVRSWLRGPRPCHRDCAAYGMFTGISSLPHSDPVRVHFTHAPQPRTPAADGHPVRAKLLKDYTTLTPTGKAGTPARGRSRLRRATGFRADGVRLLPRRDRQHRPPPQNPPLAARRRPLSTDNSVLLCCSRQAGKSTTVAALAVHTALFRAPALTLILSPSQRQSGETFRKIKDAYNALGRPAGAVVENQSTLDSCSPISHSQAVERAR